MAKSIEVVGALYTDGASFLKYLQELKWSAWRPRYVTVHHTASPSLATWNGYQKATAKRGPISDLQWLRNLGVYYANPAYDGKGRMIKGAWNAGPHFFVTPKHIGVLTPPTKRGIHAASFNHNSWGVEIVGYYDKGAENWNASAAKPLALEALAAMHVALDIDPAAQFHYATKGLHFHRDDKQTSKTCPGTQIEKLPLIEEIGRAVERLTDSAPSVVTDDHPEEHITPKVPEIKKLVGVVSLPPGDPGLNVRADASQRSPVVRLLPNGAKVEIEGHKMNGATKWLDIGDDEWVSSQYVMVKA